MCTDKYVRNYICTHASYQLVYNIRTYTMKSCIDGLCTVAIAILIFSNIIHDLLVTNCNVELIATLINLTISAPGYLQINFLFTKSLDL